MNDMKDIFKLLVLCAMTVWTMTGCGGSDARIKQQQAQADSLLNVAYRANEYKRLETLADSLQEAGLISDVKACYWLGYSNEEVETIKGRPLFIYTDGLNEAENKEKELFGDERLLDILSNTQFSSAQQVIETLGAEVEAHRHGAEPNDDLTMMCLHIPL